MVPRALDIVMITLLTVAVAGHVAWFLCLLLRPLMVRYALARPNARSSHRVPTPQGGGIAVLGGVVLALLLAGALGLLPAQARPALALVLAAAVLVAGVGAWDDIAPLPAGLRLGLQTAAVSVVLMLAAPELRLLPELLPLWAERALCILAGVWFVNLVNFMDGIDWITIAGIAPLCAALAAAGALGVLDPASGLLAAALLGGLLGFAPLNRPVAKIFLGDVGSLPIGLLTAWLLYRLAAEGALVAALILPLYHVMDSTITLLRRLARGEKVWQAHRSHFYQQATDNGFSVSQVVARVAGLNLVLAVLAGLTIRFPATAVQLGCLVLALALTALLLARFARRRTA